MQVPLQLQLLQAPAFFARRICTEKYQTESKVAGRPSNFNPGGVAGAAAAAAAAESCVLFKHLITADSRLEECRQPGLLSQLLLEGRSAGAGGNCNASAT